MTETSKAPTDADLLARYEMAQAAQARRMAAMNRLSLAIRGGKSLHQVKRSTLAAVAVAFGMTVTSTTTRTAIVNFIEEASK